MIQYYLCVGLGMYLMGKAVDHSNPLLDMPFYKEILMFLGMLALWPLSLIGNYIHSHEDRTYIEEQMKEAEEAFEKLMLSVKKDLEEELESKDKKDDSGNAQ